MNKPPLTIILADPRGFCAGVDRAIQIVEETLKLFGFPVYVRHEIVHNRFVVEGLKNKGAVFVEDLDDVPDGVPVIFSAHGVPLSVPAEAKRRGLTHIDATCPLVNKVHTAAVRHFEAGRQVILIGHAGHPEVVGTIGQLPEDAMILIQSLEDAQSLEPSDPDNLAYVTQTTLSVDDTHDIIAVLKERFPSIAGPAKEDICFATTNRQQAVKAITKRCDMLMVLGAPNSSNSKRLVEVAAKDGCAKAMLVQRAAEIDWEDVKSVQTLGITAGASAPEVLVEEVIDAAKKHFTVTLESVTVAEEDITFKLPPSLAKGT